MKKIEIHEKLRHLTMSQIETLIKEYYCGVKTSDLIKNYKIDTISSKLYTLFPPVVCEDICPICGKKMYREREAKSSSGWNKKKAFCPECNHTNDEYCGCEFCILEKEKKKKLEEERKKKIIQEKREKIKSCYSNEINPIKYEDLTFKDRVYLGALLRTALSEDMKTILPLREVDKKLAPTIRYCSFILNYLLMKNIIIVDPNSSIEAFPEGEDIEFPNQFYITYVNYKINIVNDNEDIRKTLSKIINPNNLEESDKEDALKIWKGIALEECLEYFEYSMNKVGFSFSIGEKTIATFKDLLENFSVSQIYGIIYKSIANGTKYYQEKSVNKKQAANSVIGACQRYAEKAIINNWELTKYNRIKELPQSVISEFFYDRVIAIGNLGFDIPPMEL